MIYTDKFVWIHLPKCAGSKTEQLFKKYFSDEDGIFQDIVNPDIDPAITWHDTIAEREARDPEFRLGSRIVICQFRRLPAWLESKFNFEVARNPKIAPSPELLLEGKFPESSGHMNHVDVYVNKWLPPSILNSQSLRFIRTENFELDFKSVFSDFIDISRIPNWEYEQLVNTSTSLLPDEVKTLLYNNTKRLYDNCPRWRLVEEIVYGNFLST